MTEELSPSRFEVELEFVQSLAHPFYVNFLAQNQYFEKPEFLQYLQYLEYWRQQPYRDYLVYPNCLHVLTLLQQKSFRDQIARGDIAKMVMDDMYAQWLEKGRTAEVNSDNDADVKNEGVEM
ncbi:hypothetical protein CANCADRAFT_4207 [Tortispora caseinolytica NRRL Y-17796]|uniref:Mediator of RNA polymerase II transcription subunit 31 n=1 Tax=Tortispora caseinolytica NRRL Y-17796 TaxID=767744 RepID=A0A1E4TCX4_9ASCO|nr:hypothetical protein CANCADRAFT_4207 [Tortispora caseinolytica NRRL Y-17796]